MEAKHKRMQVLLDQMADVALDCCGVFQFPYDRRQEERFDKKMRFLVNQFVKEELAVYQEKLNNHFR